MEEQYFEEYRLAAAELADSQLSQRQNKLLTQLEVAVSVELATLTLSAASLIDWAAGERVALSLPESETVMLSVGGERIAKAYLRKEGEQLFLEIAELCQETSG